MDSRQVGSARDSQDAPLRPARIFAALRYPSFRLLWLGLTLSLIGGWMQQLAGPWLVYRLTASVFDLGLMGFISVLPAAPLSLLAGPLIDRLPRRRLLIATQLALFVPPIGLALLTWTGHVRVWQVIVAEALRGMVAAIDQPAKQVVVAEMTGTQDVSSALGLWSVSISIARIIGPALAGALVVWGGEALCFALHGIGYLTLLVVLLAVRLAEPDPAARAGARGIRLGSSLMEGWRYLARERVIVIVASLTLAASVWARPYQTLLPVYAKDILTVGPTGLGLLSAAAGVGAVLGALGAAGAPPGQQRRLIAAASVTLPVMVTGFAFARSPWLAGLLLLGVGGLVALLETTVNAFIQIRVAGEFRGRAMSLFGAAVMGAPRIGGLQAGWIASRWGAPWALTAGAAIQLLYSLATLISCRGRLRPDAQEDLAQGAG